MRRISQLVMGGSVVLLTAAGPVNQVTVNQGPSNQGSSNQGAAVSANGITLHSVAVSLPSEDQTLPGGDAADLITQSCTPCHSPAMILAQPPLSRSVWLQEVNKMRETYKAPVAAADVPAIVAYLVQHKGSH